MRFAIRLAFPNAYPSEKKGFDEEHQREFEKKAGDDTLRLEWAEGKRGKLSTIEPIDAAAKEVSAADIISAQVEFSSWKGRDLKAIATEVSRMALEVTDGMPLWKGFSLIWSADPSNDPQGSARLEIRMK